MAEKKNEVATQEAKDTAVAQQHVNRVTDFSLGIFGTSDNFMMARQMAQALACSTIVPQTFQKNEANCLLGIEIAQRLRTSPLLVMQNLYIIQNRPTWSAQFLISMINGSGKYDTELQYEEKQDSKGKPFSCKCFTFKNGRRIDGITIDMDMADAEGWVGKSGSKWKTIPAVMLRYRAASFFARMNCPELTLGYYTKDEVQDGDFKEYPLEDIAEQVKQEIEENANSEEFVADAEAVEKETQDAPFM